LEGSEENPKSTLGKKIKFQKLESLLKDVSKKLGVVYQVYGDFAAGKVAKESDPEALKKMSEFIYQNNNKDQKK